MPLIRIGQRTHDGARYAASPHQFDGLLAAARASAEAVHCLCRKDDPRQLVIRQIRGHHYLAVWPLDGASHTSWCSFHRDAATEARQQAQDARVGLTDGSGSPPVATAPGPLTAPQLPAAGALDPVVLPALLGKLWDLSGLQRWMPGWTRDWTRVRRTAYAAARRLSIQGVDLDQALFIPRAHATERYAREWPPDLVEHLRASGQRRLLLGVLQSASATAYGWRLAIAGLPLPVFVPTNTPAPFAAACAAAAASLPEPSPTCSDSCCWTCG